VFLVGLSLLPEAFGSFSRIGLWLYEIRQPEALFSQDSAVLVQFGSVALSAGNLAVLLSLVFAPAWWAGLLPARHRGLELSSAVNDNLSSTLVAVAGVVLVAVGAANLLGDAVQWHFSHRYHDSALQLPYSGAEFGPRIARSSARVLIGAGLALRARAVVGYLERGGNAA